MKKKYNIIMRNCYEYMEKFVQFVPNHLSTNIINNARHFRFFNVKHKKKNT